MSGVEPEVGQRWRKVRGADVGEVIEIQLVTGTWLSGVTVQESDAVIRYRSAGLHVPSTLGTERKVLRRYLAGWEVAS